ncbi:SGNH/GDSL hydrolase family protein [Fibrobacterota bacterium]
MAFPDKSKHTGMIKNSIFFFMVSAALVLSLEMCLRLYGYMPKVSVPPFLYDNHPETWWTLRPGFSGVWKSKEGDILYRINEQGIRSSSRYRHIPRGSGRVFIIGDSYTFGIGVNEEASFARKLQDKLRLHHSGAEVVNLGVPGFGTKQSYHRLLEKAQQLGVPDAVIYIFCPNDPVDNIAGKKVVVGGIRVDAEKNHKYFLSLVGRGYYASRLLAFTLDRIYSRFANPRTLKQRSFTDAGKGKQDREDILVTGTYLGFLNEWTRLNGAAFVVATTNTSGYSPLLRNLADSLGFHFIEGDEVFNQVNLDKQNLKLLEGHWNGLGHEFFSQGLSKYVLIHGLLPNTYRRNLRKTE